MVNKHITTFLLLFSFGSTFVFSQSCEFLIEANIHDTCGLNRGQIALTVNGGTPPYSFKWSNGDTTATISNLTSGTYAVTVAEALCTRSGIELVKNGDFTLGNLDFTSNYTYCNTSSCVVAEGLYTVGADPNYFHPAFCTCPDHTTGTGNFMVINGTGTPNTNIWCQSITVTPNTTYNFSTWVSSVYASEPAQLQFYINGIALGNIFEAPTTCCTWLQFFEVWNSGANTSADICVVNQNTTAVGNDFGLDDVSFQVCASCETTATYKLSCEIEIPNVFSPNGDGKNDKFIIKNLHYFPLSKVVIYNRWGKIVYENADYLNNWDGNNVSDGTYYCIIYVSDGRTIPGFLTLLR